MLTLTRDPKVALAFVAIILVVLVALRDVVPQKWQKPFGTLLGAVVGLAAALGRGEALVDSLDDMAMMSVAGLAGAGVAPGRRPPPGGGSGDDGKGSGPPTPKSPRADLQERVALAWARFGFGGWVS